MDKEQLIQGIVESVAKCQRPNLGTWQAVGLSHAQAGVLFLVLTHKKVTSKAIAEYLGISKSAATQLVDPLLDKGLLNRQIDPTDRRIGWLSLSPTGKQKLKELQKHKFAGLRSNLEVLSTTELRTLYKLHKKMADAV